MPPESNMCANYNYSHLQTCAHLLTNWPPILKVLILKIKINRFLEIIEKVKFLNPYS